MPFLVLVVVVLFVGVQLFQWLMGVILPLPIYVMAGAFLAIASNYDKGMAILLNRGQELMPNNKITPGETMTAQLESPEVLLKSTMAEVKSLPELSLNGDEIPL